MPVSTPDNSAVYHYRPGTVCALFKNTVKCQECPGMKMFNILCSKYIKGVVLVIVTGNNALLAAMDYHKTRERKPNLKNMLLLLGVCFFKSQFNLNLHTCTKN